MILLYLAQVYPVVPLGFIKLAGLVALVVIPLQLAHNQPEKPSVLSKLDRPFQSVQLAPLLAIPAFASLVYALAAVLPPKDGWLRLLYISIYSLQTLVGSGFFLWAWIDSIYMQVRK